jgi:hypothetical protein
MMRIRCPHHGCSIEVPGDFAGKWIRCPQCAQSVFVEPRGSDDANIQIQPSMSLELDPRAGPTSGETTEKRVHAGLPPLSIMLGLREGRGRAWNDEADVRAHMTPADWKALAAFETVCRTVWALREASYVGVAACLLTVLAWIATSTAAEFDVTALPGRAASRASTLGMLLVGFFLMGIGRRRLAVLRMGVLVELAGWASLGAAVVFALNVALTLTTVAVTRHRYTMPFFELLVIPFQLIAMIVLVRSSLALYRAQRAVSPPDILYRLTEALAHLVALV